MIVAPPSLGNIMGLRLIVSENALEATEERLFPYSKHRSKRIRKKLMKRFGGEFRKVPAIFMTRDTIIMHPVMYEQFERAARLSA